MARLLMVATIGGTMRSFLYPFAEAFRARGWQVDGMARRLPAEPGAATAFDRAWEAEWSRQPFKPRNFIVAARQVRRVVAAGRYDLVHVHTPVAAFITRYALRRHRARKGWPIVIYTAHGFHFHPHGNPALNAVFAGLESLAGRWTDFLVVINRQDEAAARDYALVDREHIVYMPGIGVDSEALRPDAVPEGDVQRLRQELGLREGDRLLAMLASFAPDKRHSDAIRALAMLGDRRVHLAFAGTGNAPEELLRMIRDFGLAGQIHILGFREDAPVLLRAAEAMILTSTREGLSRSVLECMALGVPVIGTNARGIGELLSNGCGLTVDVGDVRALARAMEWLLAHRLQARAMGQRGRDSIARYDVRRIIGLHEALYARALAELRARRVAVGVGAFEQAAS